MTLRTGDMLMGLFKRCALWKEWMDDNLDKFKRMVVTCWYNEINHLDITVKKQ